MAKISIGLVHYPVKDRSGTLVATNITNLDIHDIARASRVYGVEKYFIIHPIQEQLMYVERIKEFWRIGDGLTYNPKRSNALITVETAESIENIQKIFPSKVVVTSAKSISSTKTVGFRAFREHLSMSNDNYLILFGTGHGLDETVLESADHILEPIKGSSKDDYRHLSVRSAVSICLDRLFGS